jgi:predicted porin
MFNLGEICMKKALIALAVLGVASGAAMAQSSVTLYGVADIAVGTAKSAGDTKFGAQTNTLVTNGTSRIGLMGREDLGSGLWAGFRYETPVNLATGSSNTVNPLANGSTWSREANVMLGSNSIGTLKLGRSTTPSYDGQGKYDLTGWANYSVLANTFGWGASAVPRNNAQVEYMSPNWSGFGFAASYIFKADGAVVAPAGVNNKTDRWDLNLAYVQGPIKAAITANKMSGSASNQANKLNWTVGGSYTFGNMFALAVSYNRANSAQAWRLKEGGCDNVYACAAGAYGPSVGGPGAAAGARRYGWELGGSFFTGPFTVTLDLTRDTKNDLYGGKKYTNGVLEGKYALSKRTFLYADYLRLDGDNNYGLGVRHNF